MHFKEGACTKVGTEETCHLDGTRNVGTRIKGMVATIEKPGVRGTKLIRVPVDLLGFVS